MQPSKYKHILSTDLPQIFKRFEASFDALLAGKLNFGVWNRELGEIVAIMNSIGEELRTVQGIRQLWSDRLEKTIALQQLLISRKEEDVDSLDEARIDKNVRELRLELAENLESINESVSEW